MRWLLKPQLPTSNYNPNAVFVSHLTSSLGGFLLALSPFEVAVDYRAGSVISPWKVFGSGGRKSITPVQGSELGWGINGAAQPSFPLRGLSWSGSVTLMAAAP